MTIVSKKINIKKGFLSLLLVLSSILIMAQPTCDPMTDPYCEDPDAELPIDSNMIIFLVFGASIGSYILLQEK